MNRKLTTTGAAGLLILALAGAQGGCGSSSNGGAPTHGATKVEIQGQPGAARQCKMTLIQHEPVQRQLVATLTVTCNFPLVSAYTTLVIQGRPVGGDNTQWDNLGTPKPSSETENITLTYKVPCITALEYQSSASIDASGADGTPVHADQETTPRAYNATQCAGK